MRRVGITQRQIHVPERGEVRDALDTRLAALVWQLGFVPLPLPNLVDDPASLLAQYELDAIVLSGGDDVGVTPMRDAFESACLDHAEVEGLPVLGLCRGFQVINLRLGGRLDRGDGHAGTRHRIEWIDATSVESSPAPSEVNSFHDHVIGRDSLAIALVPLALADDGTVEAARHIRLPWFGMMWHPERESPPRATDLSSIMEVLEGRMDA